MRPALVWTSLGVLVSIFIIMALQLSLQKSERFNETCDYTVIFFYCRDCEQYRPEWLRVVDFITRKYQGKVCTQEYPAENREMSKEYVVNGYPTIVIENAFTKRRVTYDGQSQPWTAFGTGVFDNAASIRAFFAPHINTKPLP